MLSISNASVEDRILAAAASCVTDFGVERVTLAEIARRARVSRPTVYRRWPDTRSVLAALLTSHITATLDDVPIHGHGRAALVDRVVAVAARLRGDELVMAVLRSELALVYIAQRLGSSQQMLIDALARDLRAAHRDGRVRPADPPRLAAMVLLLAQATIPSAEIVRPLQHAAARAAELAYSQNGHFT
jgi:AcrR family transcriptional regulator